MKHVLAFLLFASCSAFAASSGGNGSEYQWQTPADKIEVTPRLDYINRTDAPKTGSDTKVTGFHVGLLGEYGISEMFSAGLSLSNLSYTINTTPETKKSGLEDLNVFFHGRSEMGMGSLRYGIDVGFGLAKSETKTNGDQNASSGGMSLAPFVGYEMNMAPCTYGARLSYKMFMGDRTHTNGATEEKLSGPTTTSLALFYEHDMAPMKIGAALEIEGSGSYDTKVNGTSSGKTSGETMTGVSIYAPYEINPMITVVPAFKYAKATSMPSTTDSTTYWTLGASGRFTF